MKRFLAVAVVLVAVACSSSGKAAVTTVPVSVVFNTTTTVPPPSCADWFKAGTVVTDVAYMNTACTDTAGGRHVYSAGTETCLDGRVLMWNDGGWAYAGGPLTGYPSNGEQVGVPPVSVRQACKP